MSLENADLDSRLDSMQRDTMRCLSLLSRLACEAEGMALQSQALAHALLRTERDRQDFNATQKRLFQLENSVEYIKKQQQEVG